MGSKGVNLGSKISNSRSVDFFRFFRIFSDFFDFFFEKVVFFQAFRPNFRPDGPILETRKPQNKIFQTQKRGYAKFKENRQSRFGWAQKLEKHYKTQIIPLQKWIHTHTGKVDTKFLPTPRFARRKKFLIIFFKTYQFRCLSRLFRNFERSCQKTTYFN